jgi:hypothetical protein
MPFPRAALGILALATAALFAFGPGCGGKVGAVGPGSNSGTGDSSGVVSLSSGIGSSSGTTSSSGVGSSGTSASSGSSGSSGGIGSSSGSSGGSSSGSSGSSSGVFDAGAPSCTTPATSVPSSEIPPYVSVSQQVGACSAMDIATFITACDSATASSTSCNSWFSTASPSCVSCLGSPDAGPPRSGGLWYDGQGNFIGANAPGCDAIVDGNGNCASPYDAAVQCLLAAGCGTCTTQSQYQTCEQQVFGSGGACETYLGPTNTACMADFEADGGALNDGLCSSDAQILSVICGNGSGDGG